MRGAIPPLTHRSSWRGTQLNPEQLRLYLLWVYGRLFPYPATKFNDDSSHSIPALIYGMNN
jgi:hypothetical protein